MRVRIRFYIEEKMCSTSLLLCPRNTLQVLSRSRHRSVSTRRHTPRINAIASTNPQRSNLMFPRSRRQYYLPSHHVQHEERLIQLMEDAIKDAVPVTSTSSTPTCLRASWQVGAKPGVEGGATNAYAMNKNVSGIKRMRHL